MTQYHNLGMLTLQMQNGLVKKYGLRQGQDEKALWGAVGRCGICGTYRRWEANPVPDCSRLLRLLLDLAEARNREFEGPASRCEFSAH